jgi:hypothetical protein
MDGVGFVRLESEDRTGDRRTQSGESRLAGKTAGKTCCSQRLARAPAQVRARDEWAGVCTCAALGWGVGSLADHS